MSLKRKYSHEMEEDEEEVGSQPRSGKTSDAVSSSPPPDAFSPFPSYPLRLFTPHRAITHFCHSSKAPRRAFIPFRVRLAVMSDGFRMDRYADLGLVCDRLQLPELLQECRSGRGLIRLPARHHGPYPPPPHKCHHYRPNASVCTLALPATRRSLLGRNSSTILGPITKRAGSLFSTASNDGLCLLFPFPSTRQRPVPHHPHTPDLLLPASYPLGPPVTWNPSDFLPA